MTRKEFKRLVATMCEDNYGEELTARSVIDNWETLQTSLIEDGEIEREFGRPTKREIAELLKGRII